MFCDLLTERCDEKIQVIHEKARDITGEQHNFSLGVIPESLDNIGQAGNSIETPDIDRRVIKGDFKNTWSRLVGSEPGIHRKVETSDGRDDHRNGRQADPRERHF